jgi:glycerophosphoryl diester phosphodiesterase
MEIVAHRGYGGAFPENTRHAFERAAETADWVELDVRACQSGELVVFHDETLDRLTGASGRVVATPWEDLRELEVLGSGERVPLLEEALSAIPDDTGVQVELKDVGLAGGVLETLSASDNEAVLISFSPLALHEVTQFDPSADVGHILYEGLYDDAPELGLDTAGHLGCETVHTFYAMGSDPGVVAAAHDRGLRVQTAPPDRRATGAVREECREAGVDLLSVDHPPETV